MSEQAYFLALPRLESICFGLSGTRIVGKNKAGCGCTPPLYFWVENTFSFRTLPHSALLSPAGHATAKHQRPAARLDEKGIAGVFDALYLFVSLQGYRMKPIHKCRVPQQPLRRDNQRQVALGTHVLNPFRCAQILAAPMREGFLKTIQMLIGGHETEFSNHLRCGNMLVYRQRLYG